MTREEYEERDRCLAADIAAAYEAFNKARDYWDGLCRERRDLHHQWRQQRKKEGER